MGVKLGVSSLPKRRHRVDVTIPMVRKAINDQYDCIVLLKHDFEFKSEEMQFFYSINVFEASVWLVMTVLSINRRSQEWRH